MSEKIIGDLIPFNEVMYKDCFYHAVLPIYRFYIGGIEPLLLNDICLEYFVNKNKDKPLLKMRNISSKSLEVVFMEAGIDIRKGVIKSENIVEQIVHAIDHDEIVVIRIDCYYEPLRKDSFHEYHAGHVIPIYGYDLENNNFRILEGDFIDSVVYSPKELGFEDVKNAYNGYLKNFHNDNDTYYAFHGRKEISYNFVAESKKEFVQKLKQKFNDYYTSIEKIKEYKMMLESFITEGYNCSISDVVTASNKLIDEIVVQKYLFSKLFNIPLEYDQVMDETIRLWKSIRAILTKYMFKKNMNERSFAMLNKMLDEVYFNELKRYSLLKSICS